MPEHTPTEVVAKEAAFERLLHRTGRERVRALADAIVAPFFLPKTADNVTEILTDDTYREMLRGYAGWQTPATVLAKAVSAENRFFHWFLEFPDVFQKDEGGGFDCVLGNPPFLGGLKISTNYGSDYLNHLHTTYRPTGGTADFVAYFFRRAFWLIKEKGFLSLISTNTIAQGDTRAGSLELLIGEGGTINHAVRSMKWPGQAAVEVSLVTVTRQTWQRQFTLNSKAVDRITVYLDESEDIGNPCVLEANAGKSFIGSFVLGKGFVLEPDEARRIVATDTKYYDVIFPYLNGEDLNNIPDQSPSRYVINFFEWPLRRYSNEEWNNVAVQVQKQIQLRILENKAVEIAPPSYSEPVASDYPLCMDIVEKFVRPERMSYDETKNAWNKSIKTYWWRFGAWRKGLSEANDLKGRVLALAIVSKTHALSFTQTHIVCTKNTVSFAFDDNAKFSVLQSFAHEEWAWKYSSTMKSDRNYSPSDCYGTFPFPLNLTTQQEAELETIGEQYHEHRKQLMLGMQLGLTKTYNLFHSQLLRPATTEEMLLDDKPFEKLLGKEAAHLRKHFARTPEVTLTFNEAVTGIERLRALHVQMDTAVRNAYDWHDLDLGHAFHEVDYLPENDRVRYTISPVARKEVLKRLLLLNHKLYAEEQAAKAAQLLLFGEAKATPKKGKAALNTAVQEPDIVYKVVKLKPDVSLGIDFNTNMKEFGLHQGIYSVSDAATMLDLPTNKVRDWFRELVREGYEGLSDDQRVDAANRRISFHGLIELYVIGKLRDDGVPIRPILNARADLKNKTGKQYPFATNNVKDRLRTDGRRIYFYFEGEENPVTLDGSGQFNLNLIQMFFDTIEFDNGVAQRMFPARGNRKVVINPKQGNGKPVIVNKEVLVNLIASIYDGPESLPMLSEEYNLSEEEVRGALNYAQVSL